MKKYRLLGALLAGVMALTGIPSVTQPLTAAVSAAERLKAPSGIKFTATDTTVTITWDAVKGADAYRIFKTKGYSYTSTEFETYKTVKGTKCTVTGLSAENAYKFKIAALLKSANGYAVQEYSNVFEAVTKAAAPRNITVSSSANTVMLTWSSNYRASGYRVYKYNSKKKAYVKYKDVTTASCIIDGLKEGTTYRFKVAVLMKVGDKSVPQMQSGVLSATTAKAEKVELPVFPAFGKSSAEVIKKMGIKNYSAQNSGDQGTTYLCGIESSGLVYGLSGSASLSGTMLMFDNDDRFYGAAYLASSGSLNILAATETLTAKNGKGETIGDSSTQIILWEKKDSMEMLVYSGGIVGYIVISTKYMPESMKKNFNETMKKYKENASASAGKDQ